MKIFYDNRTNEKILSLKTLIKTSLNEVLSEENAYKNVELSISFVTDEEIRDINNEFRNKNSATDVLSFPMIEYEKGRYFKDLSKEELEEAKDIVTGKVNLGDIVISIETIRKQAKRFNNSFERELCLMVIHSMLHLMGYDHMIKNEEKVMFGKQEKILERVI